MYNVHIMYNVVLYLYYLYIYLQYTFIINIKNFNTIITEMKYILRNKQ